MNTSNGNKLDYSLLPDGAKKFVHEIELRACAMAMIELLGVREADRAVRSIVLQGLNVNAFEYELEQILARRQPSDKRKEHHAFYYLVAGVGIKRITQYLSCGQALVYRVRDADYTDKKSILDGMFQIYPQTIWNIQNMKRHLNVLNNHDATKSEWIPRQFPTRNNDR